MAGAVSGGAFSFAPGTDGGATVASAGGAALPGTTPDDPLPPEVSALVVRLELLLARFSTRVGAYVVLLVDDYPSTDEERAVHLDISYPNVPNDLNRWLALVKWLLAIPHFIILVFLGIAVVVVTIIAWFAIIFTGKYPRGMFSFVVGVMRWGLRVEAYAFLLTTDKYPPFSLD